MSEDRETQADAPAANTPAAEAPAEAETANATEALPAPATHEAPAVQTAPEPKPGAPVEESEATATEVLAAVDRAGDLSGEAAPAPVEAAESAATTVIPEGRPPIVLPDEMPSAGPTEPVAQAPVLSIPDDKILVSANHPMAALYMQTPMPPDLRGNRGPGVAIALLATIVFAALFGAVLYFAAGTGASFDMLVQLFLWPFIAAVATFFIGYVLLILIVGRAGWWAHVLGGFLVAALVWAATDAGLAFATYQLSGASGLSNLLDGSVTPITVIQHYGLLLPSVAAGVIAREVIVWFGAWIGARGRKVSRANAEALAEYETALAEAQAKQP